MNLTQTKQQIKSLERILDQCSASLQLETDYSKRIYLASAITTLGHSLMSLDLLLNLLTPEKKNQK